MGASTGGSLLVQRVILCDGFQIHLRVAIQDQICVCCWVIVDQPIRFGMLMHILGNFIFNSRTVNGDHGAVGVFHFYAGSIDIERTAYNFFRNSLLNANPEMCWFP